MIVDKDEWLASLTMTSTGFAMAFFFSTLYKEFVFEEQRLTTMMTRKSKL